MVKRGYLTKNHPPPQPSTTPAETIRPTPTSPMCYAHNVFIKRLTMCWFSAREWLDRDPIIQRIGIQLFDGSGSNYSTVPDKIIRRIRIQSFNGSGSNYSAGWDPIIQRFRIPLYSGTGSDYSADRDPIIKRFRIKLLMSIKLVQEMY